MVSNVNNHFILYLLKLMNNQCNWIVLVSKMQLIELHIKLQLHILCKPSINTPIGKVLPIQHISF